MPTKPQDIEKVTISTQIVNVDAVVYHKKSGQIVTDLKKPNFAIFADGVQQDDHKLFDARSADYRGDGRGVQQVVGDVWTLRQTEATSPALTK